MCSGCQEGEGRKMRALKWPASGKKSGGRKGFLAAEGSQAPGRREEGKNLMRRGGGGCCQKMEKKVMVLGFIFGLGFFVFFF